VTILTFVIAVTILTAVMAVTILTAVTPVTAVTFVTAVTAVTAVTSTWPSRPAASRPPRTSRDRPRRCLPTRNGRAAARDRRDRCRVAARSCPPWLRPGP
jgi:hypothetical protein